MGQKKMLGEGGGRLSRRESKLENPFPKIDPLPGTIHAEYRRCGRAGCRCERGELHGPYFRRYWWGGGKQHKTYVRQADLDRMRAACQEHKAIRAMIRDGREVYRQTMQQFRQMVRFLRQIGA